MRTIGFYGASDDLVEIEGYRPGEPDEIGSDFAVLKVATDDEGLLVVVSYNPVPGAACWMIGLSQLDEDVPLPDHWIQRWETHERGYSVRLRLLVPDDAVISRVQAKKDW